MGYQIIPMDLEQHRQALLALWREGLEECTDERFDWLYTRNPSGVTRTYLALDEKSRSIVGCASLVPRHINMAGNDVVMGVAADFIITARHRAFGPALKLQRELFAKQKEHGFCAILAFPNASAEGVFSRTGYKPLGKAIRYVRLIKAEIKLRETVKNRMLAKILGFVLDNVWSIMSLDIRRILTANTYTFETVDNCDSRFDTLWDKAKQGYPITGEKVSSYLNWRYPGDPSRRHRFFCILSRTGELLGYLVYIVREGVAMVGDLFFVTSDEQISRRLLTGFVKEMKAQGAHSVTLTYLGSGALAENLRKAGFFPRKEQERTVFLGQNVTGGEVGLERNGADWCLLDDELDL
ncbi:MAG TPA: GNAT family N-acetyltransferase [Syntrophorhabdaceae bacterium]|nr:GNAT family N-acetyltransferase [Syntrophorhabdaceae bacterium]